ncbi:MAG: GGDEF domain-containing protein [Sphingomonadales bacterium]
MRSVSDTVSILGIPADETTPKVREAIMQLMAEVDRLRVDLDMTRRRLGEMERLADLDPLAPISNRRAFVRELTRMIAFSERYGAPGSLIYLDLNDLKGVNDQFGHGAGDAALRHVATILLDNIRESDIVGRLGGDEFGVILVQSDEETARVKAEKLVAAIADEPFKWEDHELSLKTANGVYAFRPGEDANRAMAEADKAMYARKRDMKKSL